MRFSNKKLAKRRRESARRRAAVQRRTRFEGLESRQLLTSFTFQQGLNGYAGQEDTVLYSRQPEVNFGTEGSISPDQQDANGVRQGLVKFGDIFGNLPGQIPLGSTINSATLIVDVVNDSNSSMQMSLFRMQEDWSESTATWSSFGDIGGVQASEGEASDFPPDSILFDPDTSANSPTAGRFDVKTSLQYWAAGDSNFGWMVESAATNGWDFRTKESAQAQRPRLIVDFTAPSGAGQFEFLNTAPTVGEGDAGMKTTLLEVYRVGGVTGAASVNYTITAGTATAGSDFVAASGTLNFASGETVKTIPVDILGDTALEGNETVVVTLSGAPIVAGQGVATLSIGDDDALINEVLANVSNASDETNREYIELIGTPGASLNGYYFTIFEGEEEELGGTAGEATGIADLVIDLSGQTFGSNGLLVITPSNWAYTAAAGTNVFSTAALDGAGGKIEDSSQTYALIRSLGAPIVQGVDYDTIGAYENATNQAIGTGLGILDQLPAGAQVVDSVGVVEGGGGDRDRTLAPPEIGNPGVHVHQPTGVSGSSGVTSDAVSRRAGQKLPNSIGAWFNGDILSGDDSTGPITYANDTFFISVVAPDGAVLTPGAPNVLRTVFFDVEDQNAEVAEADGSVTVMLRRTGDLNETVDVTYTTIGGTAQSGVDFVAKTETVTFGVGVAEIPVTINLIPDSVAEGFERFTLQITDASGDYLVTNGRVTGSPAANGLATVTIADADVSTATFQNGVNGYFGTQDATIDGDQLFDTFGQDGIVRVDQVKGEGEDTPTQIRPQQGLIRFDNLFGAGAGQVPFGSQIFDAFLTVNVTNVSSGAEVNFFKMEQDWEEINATWLDPQGSAGGSILNGVTPDGVEASATPDGTVPDAGRAGLVEIPLDVDTLQAWANGADQNYGWSIISDSASLWSFNSSEAFATGTFRPELTILYTAPESGNTGTFGLSDAQYRVNEDAGSASITITRKGGSTGAATVNWSLSLGTGSAADVSTLSGSVNFASGELFKTFNIGVTNDLLVEANEKFTLTLSGAGLDFSRSEAELTIRDNDFNPFASNLLLNEIWINSPGNDPPYEFVELTGTAGIGMGSLYYVAVEGLVGDRTGVAEKVVDIGDFRNGTNGHTLLTPDAADFGFNVPAGATQIDRLGSIGTENVASQNDSTTYLLLYSPFTDLTTTSFDYDWDDDGSLELPSGVQIVDSLGVRVLGAEDQLYGPSTNVAAFGVSDPDVDAVSRFRGDTQRNRGTSWFGGDLFPAGDDYLLYEAGEAFGLPVAGAALTPGETNVGTAAQSPLVSLVSSSVAANGLVTLTFNGPISQVTEGDGGAVGPGGEGISITDTSGVAIPGVDAVPVISGFGTNTLTLSFTGAATTPGGGLPSGNFQLNLVGNGIIGNGRAVDTANTGSVTGSDRVLALSRLSAGDFNADGRVDNSDLNLLLANWGSSTVPPTWVNGFSGTVDNGELNALLGDWGLGAGAATSFATTSSVDPVESAVAAEPASSTKSTDAAFAYYAAEETQQEEEARRERRGFRRAVVGMRG
ncbi:Calx-beta domain-containing protein [Botrimarina hoheduenensis]|uniref:Calx-beta domain protein n=1 Tax=Botrimarina hoheduenensis TaxID=2528000 RepID=A0A5C5VWT8_9BACT|nr:Calx-beta domain-containing protein [Botrimarina hoheduenensis]TWT43126.1 Calx-beta domain protein [Botrimarina hoheduenensis]